MSRSITFTFAVIGLLSVPVCADGQELRYGWKAGERYVYSVRIEIEAEEIVEELTGTSYYTVRAADQDGITLIHGGRLFPTACKILKVIGTSESNAVLEKASRDKNGLVAKAAKDAAKAIASRK